MSRQRTKAEPKRNPNAARVENRQRQMEDDALAEDLAAFVVASDDPQEPSVAVAKPTAYEVSFDPLSRKFGLYVTGNNPEVWPDGSGKALEVVAEDVCYSSRDFACWFLCAARLAGFDARTFLALVDPVPSNTDGAEDYLHQLFEEKAEILKRAEGQAKALKKIVGSEDDCIWFFKSERLSFGVSSRPPRGRVIETKEDCLNPYLFDLRLENQPILFTLANAAADLAGVIKPILLNEPEKNPDDVWSLAQRQFADSEKLDTRERPVLSSDRKGQARMPNETKASQTFDEALARDIEQAHLYGFGSLTKPSYRRFRKASIEHLKLADGDDDITQRAIAENVYPIAVRLFPESIKSAKDIDANGEVLTSKFQSRAAKPKVGKRPKPTETQYDEIIELMRAWRDSVRHVRVDGLEANGFRASSGGIEFQEADEDHSYIKSTRFWPEIDFREKTTEPA